MDFFGFFSLKIFKVTTKCYQGTEHQKSSKMGKNSMIALLFAKIAPKKKPQSKPSAGARSWPHLLVKDRRTKKNNLKSPKFLHPTPLLLKYPIKTT